MLEEDAGSLVKLLLKQAVTDTLEGGRGRGGKGESRESVTYALQHSGGERRGVRRCSECIGINIKEAFQHPTGLSPPPADWPYCAVQGSKPSGPEAYICLLLEGSYT